VCCGPVELTDADKTRVLGASLYGEAEADGSALISARRVGPTGKAIGLDMTDEMLELARANAAQAGVGTSGSRSSPMFVVKIGCGDACPFIPGKRYID
jgi:hypothetical protein